MPTRFDSRQTAHVWNAQSQESGQNSNGQFYFNGRTIYSYGSHFPVAWIAPDGTALFNAAGYSMTTAKHKSYARSAATNRRQVDLPDFRALHSTLHLIGEAAESKRLQTAETRQCIRNYMRRYIREYAAELARTRVAGAWDRQSASYPDAETAGEYLTRLAGLPAASWPKLQREAEALAKRKAKATAKAEFAKRKSLAIRYAEMTESEWRSAERRILADYCNPQEQAGEEKRRVDKMLREAAELGLSRRRVESLKRLKARLKAIIPVAYERRQIIQRNESTRRDILCIRTATKAEAEAETHPTLGTLGYQGTALGHILCNAAEAAKRLSESGRLPFVSRRRLAISAERLAERGGALKAEYLAAVAAEREREAERRRLEAAERQKRLAELPRLWRSGEERLLQSFDSEHGGAALRIVGDTLETSHGASVPLAHAVRVFRFVKLCRDQGREWHRNGHCIRVGHFQVDSIRPDGSFTAGCHSFAWPEVESAARQAGVFDAAPDDSAVEPSGRAA